MLFIVEDEIGPPKFGNSELSKICIDPKSTLMEFLSDNPIFPVNPLDLVYNSSLTEKRRVACITELGQ
jgi:hypothetical protein